MTIRPNLCYDFLVSLCLAFIVRKLATIRNGHSFQLCHCAQCGVLKYWIGLKPEILYQGINWLL